ncbi:integrase [Longimycelium tulufanense]|uniref:Integrase n=1 Tax=Longimycelium tulufanense TaxID=907463 RepID=A0A8J3CAH0_9PSEU|nr:recombinase family protein [Longimycelium tulufanense]GGM64969.1 integrase [Longimycelium tulufanense]
MTDATTSPERQRAVIEQWADANGHEVVGWAVDLDVSRSIDPLNAPKLGPWFNEPEKVEAWDIVACWKLDRIATGSIYLNKVMGWCSENGKALVSVTENFDLSTWVGRMVANVIAGVAEGELEAIRERNQSAFTHNYRKGKWRGGVPPLGYMPEKVKDICWPCKQEGGSTPCPHVGEWRYVQDPVMAPIIREIVGRFLKGESLRSIRVNLVERGVPSPRDHFRSLQGKESEGTEWQINAIKRALQSPAMLGHAVVREPLLDANGRPIRKNAKKVYGAEQVVRDDAGRPIVRTEPLIDRQTFDRLQKELRERSLPPKRRKNPTSLLLQVIFCGVCDRPMYRQRGRNFDYYRCSSAQYRETCGNRSVAIDEADVLVAESLLELLGDGEHMEKVWDPGTDHANELAEIDSELMDLTGLIGTPAYRKGTPQRERLDQRIDELARRQEGLRGLPFRAAGHRYEPTGKKFSDHWEGLTPDEKNAYLRRMSVRLRVRKDKGYPEWDLKFGDIMEMVREVNPERAGLISSDMSYAEIISAISGK